MKVVILCGGQGTRIRDANEVLPKPLLPIGNMPVVWHIMKGYARYGFTDFVLCLGYKGWKIKEFFLNYRAMTADIEVNLGPSGSTRILGDGSLGEERWTVTLAETGENTQTAGRLAAVRKYIEGDECFMATYGDGVSNVDVGALVEFHRSHGKIATVTAVRPPGRFGEIETVDKSVVAFNEKPQATAGEINGGFFVFDAKRVWPYLTDDPAVLLEVGPLQALAREGQLAAFSHEGYWQPMDTLREYTLLNELWARDQAPWKTW